MTSTATITTIDIEVLDSRTRELLQRVRESGEVIDLSESGVTFARILPTVRKPDLKQRREIRQRRRELAVAIGQHWTGQDAAVDAVSEGRREL